MRVAADVGRIRDPKAMNDRPGDMDGFMSL
jgi:hypothetical protein